MGVLKVGERGFVKILTLQDFDKFQPDLKRCLIVDLDFRNTEYDWSQVEFEDTLFLGCLFKSLEDELLIRRNNAHIFPHLKDMPYHPYQSELYTPETLLYKVDPNTGMTKDQAVIKRYNDSGKDKPNIVEALSQRLHDYFIESCMMDFISGITYGALAAATEGAGGAASGQGTRRLVGFMGGHEVSRADPEFEMCARVASQLTQFGFVVTTGGGPGLMEAANFGAYMSPYSESEFQDALSILKSYPVQKIAGDAKYFTQSTRVREKYPSQATSLSVPTWYYYVEQNNPFASHIAKYFANSLREAGLTSICNSGIIFFSGSTGTAMEVFMDANNNYYATDAANMAPMIFFGKEFYEQQTKIWDVCQYFARRNEGSNFKRILLLTDKLDEAVKFLHQVR